MNNSLELPPLEVQLPPVGVCPALGPTALGEADVLQSLPGDSWHLHVETACFPKRIRVVVSGTETSRLPNLCRVPGKFPS